MAIARLFRWSTRRDLVDTIKPNVKPESTAFRVKGSIVQRLFRDGTPDLSYMIWHVSGRAYPLHEAPIDIVQHLPQFQPKIRDWFLYPLAMVAKCAQAKGACSTLKRRKMRAI